MVVGDKRERMQMFVLVILLSDQIFFIDTDQIIDDSAPRHLSHVTPRNLI